MIFYHWSSSRAYETRINIVMLYNNLFDKKNFQCLEFDLTEAENIFWKYDQNNFVKMHSNATINLLILKF